MVWSVWVPNKWILASFFDIFCQGTAFTVVLTYGLRLKNHYETNEDFSILIAIKVISFWNTQQTFTDLKGRENNIIENHLSALSARNGKKIYRLPYNLIAIMCDRLHRWIANYPNLGSPRRTQPCHNLWPISVMAHNLWLISVDLCLECLETTEGLLCGDNLKFIFKIVKNNFLGSTVNKSYELIFHKLEDVAAILTVFPS